MTIWSWFVRTESFEMTLLDIAEIKQLRYSIRHSIRKSSTLILQNFTRDVFTRTFDRDVNLSKPLLSYMNGLNNSKEFFKSLLKYFNKYYSCCLWSIIIWDLWWRPCKSLLLPEMDEIELTVRVPKHYIDPWNIYYLQKYIPRFIILG